MLDKRVPLFTKIIPLLAVVYIVSPFDFIADRIPMLGQFDDLIVTGILFLLFIAASPKEVVADQTIGRKLRDLQRQQGGGEQADENSSKGKTINSEFKYIDDEDEDEPDSGEK